MTLLKNTGLKKLIYRNEVKEDNRHGNNKKIKI